MPSFEKRGIKIFIVWGNSFLRTQSTYFRGKRLEPSGLSPHPPIYSNHHHSCTLHCIGYTGRRASLVQNVVGKLKRVFFWSSRRYPGHIDLKSGYEVGWLDQLLVHCYSDSYMGQVLYFSDNLSLHLLRRSLTMPPYHPNLLLCEEVYSSDGRLQALFYHYEISGYCFDIPYILVMACMYRLAYKFGPT
jgi:hypothetical protein